ncbi:MAG TPA: carbohydrate binding domain-containing protein, partial [Pyrinomonadaceae bacterium]
LLESNRFEEAYEVWLSGIVKADTPTYDGIPSIANGGFESEMVLSDRGFDWQFPHGFATVSASLDGNEPHSGKHSLRLDWHGDADRSGLVIQQLVLVVPKTRYRLNFAARTQSLATICAPVITIIDPKVTVRSPLAQSSGLPQNSSEWRDYTLGFTTGDTTNVILIAITRQGSEGQPCPIFGTTWLDDFSLVKN